MKKPICVYPDFVIFEENNKFWSLDQNGLRELELVLTLDEEAYSELEDGDVILFKASRSLGAERMIAYLRERI